MILETKKFFSMMSRALSFGVRWSAMTPGSYEQQRHDRGGAPLIVPPQLRDPGGLNSASRCSPKMKRGLKSIISARRKNSANNALISHGRHHHVRELVVEREVRRLQHRVTADDRNRYEQNGLARRQHRVARRGEHAAAARQLLTESEQQVDLVVGADADGHGGCGHGAEMSSGVPSHPINPKFASITANSGVTTNRPRRPSERKMIGAENEHHERHLRHVAELVADDDVVERDQLRQAAAHLHA